jgi:type VI secretion system protein ImpK
MPDFDDPFKPADSTVIRPRPGAGRRAASDAPQPQSRQPAPMAQSEPLSAGALDAVGFGLGPLVRAASPLLLLAGQLRGTVSGPDVATLRRHAMEEIRRFEDRARASGIQNETVLAARYALCAAVDEAVLSTPWGAQSEWTQQSLLVALHREAWGGEKFFDMLDRVSGDPKHHIDLMEVLYLCLSMGFAGKYGAASRGATQLADLQHDLYRRIREYRGAEPKELSPRWQGLQDRRNPLIKYVPWWVLGAGVAAIVVLVFMMYSSWLGYGAENIRKTMAGLQTKGTPAIVTGRSLVDYLGLQIANGELSVDPGGAKAVLRDFFPSGGDQVDRVRAKTLDAVCEALNHFSSQSIQVVGHTDDLPPTKRRYSGNQELSERRAENVRDYLFGCLRENKDRVSWIGKGADELLLGEADYRKASRRVEIILTGER